MGSDKCNCVCGTGKATIVENQEIKHECGCKSGEYSGRISDAALIILSDITLEPEEGHKACACGGNC